MGQSPQPPSSSSGGKPNFDFSPDPHSVARTDQIYSDLLNRRVIELSKGSHVIDLIAQKAAEAVPLSDKNPEIIIAKQDAMRYVTALTLDRMAPGTPNPRFSRKDNPGVLPETLEFNRNWMDRTVRNFVNYGLKRPDEALATRVHQVVSFVYAQLKERELKLHLAYGRADDVSFKLTETEVNRAQDQLTKARTITPDGGLRQSP